MYAFGVLLGQLLVGANTDPSDVVKAVRECSPVRANMDKLSMSCLAGLEQDEAELVELLLSSNPSSRPSASALLT